MSGIHKSKIEWTDAVWNPVSGCLHDCKYCYARKQTRRFKPQPTEWPESNSVKVAEHDNRCFIVEKPVILRDADGEYLRSTPYPQGFAPTLHTYKLDYLKTAKTPRRIFIGSMADLFGDWIPDEWIAAVFRECADAPQHVYIFLTKNPTRYTQLSQRGLLPDGDNYWYGTTTTTMTTPFWFSDRHNTFVSVEPIMGAFDPFFMELSKGKTDWIIIGAMTGSGARQHKPEREWIQTIVDECKTNAVPVFLKDNLASIWGEKLPQELPDKITAHLNRKIKPDRSKAHRVYVESVRDDKRCHDCSTPLQGKPAWRVSSRYYLCEKCNGGESA